MRVQPAGIFYEGEIQNLSAGTEYGGAAMKVLVTGGAGYIGSVAVERLLEKGHQVIVFDNLTRGHRQAVQSGAKLIEGDLANAADIALACGEKPDVVMHFAALSQVGESMQQPDL